MAMTWLALPLLLAASPSAPKPPAYEPVTATVQIIAAEEIRFTDMRAEKPAANGKSIMRQTRSRNGMPMVEFF